MQLPQFQIERVVERGQCCGCGACAGIAPAAYTMVDHVDEGLRPKRCAGGTTPVDESTARELADVCPGHALTHDASGFAEGIDPALRDEFGPVLGVWEGGASDQAVRHQGSSGGVITALAAFGLDSGRAKGVLHIRARRDRPLQNETVLSTTADDVRSAAGSRYAPASPADGIPLIEAADGPCVFIGKPCDVAAVKNAQRVRPDLDRNLTLTIALFCAGTPSTRGTLNMLLAMGVNDPDDVAALRYRGNGWPGRTTAQLRSDRGGLRLAGEDSAADAVRSLSYAEAWGDILTRHKQWRCKICPDHTGEFADIAVGDPWDVPPANDESGRSLVVARTARGAAWIGAALAAGAVDLERVPNERLRRAQPSLRTARAAVWGRVLALRLLGRSAPVYRGFPMFRAWCHHLTLRGKAQSVLGTIRRIARGRHRPNLEPPAEVIARLNPEPASRMAA
ncbi:MAG: Coenzyme F420 hydrogenase/dehydrogenase, beta subunit C-terminal domain [Phycisphaerales bacterium]|nr:Coenzyme F420 hydrogenase/dehydrogenase, beta subunit C-terminal domain [Phycisphaerales bacterium]